ATPASAPAPRGPCTSTTATCESIDPAFRSCAVSQATNSWIHESISFIMSQSLSPIDWFNSIYHRDSDSYDPCDTESFFNWLVDFVDPFTRASKAQNQSARDEIYSIFDSPNQNYPHNPVLDNGNSPPRTWIREMISKIAVINDDASSIDQEDFHRCFNDLLSAYSQAMADPLFPQSKSPLCSSFESNLANGIYNLADLVAAVDDDGDLMWESDGDSDDDDDDMDEDDDSVSDDHDYEEVKDGEDSTRL
ncbi:hypothetical protein M427DRAFT_184242, partial [Gonapodya prolifera JEL478]